VFRSLNTTLLAPRSSVQALDRWREAAVYVETRWRAVREAEPDSRAWAYASFFAALDAEKASAADLAALSLDTAA
jgi:hypothetical protein